VIITEEEVSTTYETNSDGNSNEYSDYYSPQLNFLLNKDNRMEEFKLEEEEVSIENKPPSITGTMYG